MCAADNRRYGSLGKQRLREFGETKKAMEKAQEQEKKNILKEAKRAENEELRLRGGGDFQEC
jgi:hypothetical protein